VDTKRPELRLSDRGLGAARGAMAHQVRARAPRGTVERTRPEPDQGVAMTGIEGIRVLVVDDNADLRDMFAVALRSLGAEVTTAASAMRAVEAFGQTVPDAIVCDIVLPEHDGYWVVRQVRSSEVGILRRLPLPDTTPQRAAPRPPRPGSTSRWSNRSVSTNWPR
jgi:hypothetical protein